jgi:hypothetical protein
MKSITLLLLLLLSACSTKTEPKICKVIIAEPTKAELEKFNKYHKTESTWQRRK